MVLHTTRTTLHGLGRLNHNGAFKGFIMDDTALSAYHASAERLAFYALVFSLINSAVAVYEEVNNGKDMDIAALTRLRDIIFSTAALTGYLMDAVGQTALLEDVSWMSVWGALSIYNRIGL